MLYTILDIETTGLGRYTDDIISFGFIRINSNWEIKASGTLYFYKERFNIENPDAFKVHKITRDFLKPHAVHFKDNIAKMYSLCYESTIVGKNSNSFDIPFIREFIGKYVPALAELKVTRAYDIQKEFSPYFRSKTGTNKIGKLMEYVELLGITEDDIREVYNSLPDKDGAHFHAHGAMYDCIATLLVFKKHCEIQGITI